MGLNIKLEDLRGRLREEFARLQPYNHRPLMREEIEIRNSIIRAILSVATEFRAIECGLAV